ncbi:MAG: hypothetical protein KAG14_00090 [Mycoplasmataceae bacterium]|nr:hypothetical protein [Mycoplasmataceae bacterium]
MKKILLGLGTIATIVVPIVAVVSCGPKKHINTLKDEKIAAKNSIDGIENDESKRIDDAKNIEDIKNAVERIKFDRKDITYRMITTLLTNILDNNLLDVVSIMKSLSSVLPASFSKYMGLIKFASTMLDKGIRASLGPALEFETKIKELFNIDLSKSKYLPLIKGILYGFDSKRLEELNKISIISIDIGSLKLEFNIHDFISDITNKGFVYAIHNAPFYRNTLVKMIIEKIPGFDPVDKTKDAKFAKYYGDTKITTDANNDETVMMTKPGFISKIFREGILNIDEPIHILIESFIGDIDDAKLMPLVKSALILITKPGEVNPINKFLSPIFNLLKNINILSDANNHKIASLIHKIITKGVSDITIEEFAELISLLRRSAMVSNSLGKDDIAAAAALHKLLEKNNKLGDMTIKNLADIIVPIIETLKRIFGDLLPEIGYIFEGVIKAASAIYSKDTDTLKSLIPIIMMLVKKFI